MSQYNYEVNFGTCGMGSERVFNKKVCFIDPNDFREDLHGVKATDDPLYLGEARFGKREKKNRWKDRVEEYPHRYNDVWREYHRYWAEKGKIFQFRGGYWDGDVDSAPPLTDEEKLMLKACFRFSF